MPHTVTRYHDISCGHRVVGHESKCRFLHGHNYRVYFTCQAELDQVGRVIDFSVIKEKLCMWLERSWDHKFLLWRADPFNCRTGLGAFKDDGVVEVPFNPTAENMAEFLVRCVGPSVLHGTGVKLIKVTVEETRKCSATFEV